jgi:hypothetical protein
MHSAANLHQSMQDAPRSLLTHKRQCGQRANGSSDHISISFPQWGQLIYSGLASLKTIAPGQPRIVTTSFACSICLRQRFYSGLEWTAVYRRTPQAHVGLSRQDPGLHPRLEQLTSDLEINTHPTPALRHHGGQPVQQQATGFSDSDRHLSS